MAAHPIPSSDTTIAAFLVRQIGEAASYLMIQSSQMAVTFYLAES